MLKEANKLKNAIKILIFKPFYFTSVMCLQAESRTNTSYRRDGRSHLTCHSLYWKQAGQSSTYSEALKLSTSYSATNGAAARSSYRPNISSRSAFPMMAMLEDLLLQHLSVNFKYVGNRKCLCKNLWTNAQLVG